MNYTFFNRGSGTAFNPQKRTVGSDGKSVTSLELHMELVRDANRRDVYILDHKGREVNCDMPSQASANAHYAKVA